MKKTHNQESTRSKSLHSKAFTEGINSLYDEIQLAFQWHRPSILLAVHNTIGGQLIAQQFLEKKLRNEKKVVVLLKPQKNAADVIERVCSMPQEAKTVFFISGLENANQLSQGAVYRALNLHREHLVEKKICAVFWLTELEAANLPRFAPDFWAFRHRVVEFAPRRGPRNPSVPSGLFLWKDRLPWMDPKAIRDQIVHLEDLLSKLPNEDSAMTSRLDLTLKLIHLNWQLNDLEQFSRHFENMLILLKTHLNFQYHGWTLNARGIKLFEDGDKPTARTCFEQALSIEPNNGIFLMNSAILAHGSGKNRESILTARRAIKDDPTHFELWHVLGLLQLFMGKSQDAVESLQKSLELQPHELNIQYALAISYSRNNQPEACSAQLLTMQKEGPSHNALQSACHAILSGNMDEALARLDRALKTSEINQHQLLEDPNLRALLDPQTLMSIGE